MPLYIFCKLKRDTFSKTRPNPQRARISAACVLCSLCLWHARLWGNFEFGKEDGGIPSKCARSYATRWNGPTRIHNSCALCSLRFHCFHVWLQRSSVEGGGPRRRRAEQPELRVRPDARARNWQHPSGRARWLLKAYAFNASTGAARAHALFGRAMHFLHSLFSCLCLKFNRSYQGT